MEYMQRFDEIKNAYKFMYHGVDLSRVMIFEIYDCALGRCGWGWRSMFYEYDLSLLSLENGKPVLSTFGQQNRKDHKEVYDYVYERIKDISSYNDLNQLKISRSFHPFRSLCVVIRSLWGLKNCKTMDFKCKLKFSFKACIYCNSLCALERLHLDGVKKYLSMYHVDQLENMITQYMKLRGIPTCSLCEGVYVVDKENLTIDSVNYTNFETDKLLVWGQHVVDAFKKEGIPEERMVVCGYPHKVIPTMMTSSNPFKRCVVLLARGDFSHSNFALLDILANYSEQYEFHLKLHPNCSRRPIQDFANEHNMSLVPSEKTVGQCVDGISFDWAIAVNTSAYYEALMRGVPCLRFFDGSFKMMPGLNDSFSGKKGFVELMHAIQSGLKDGEYQRRVNDTLQYVVGWGIDLYRDEIKRGLV